MIKMFQKQAGKKTQSILIDSKFYEQGLDHSLTLNRALQNLPFLIITIGSNPYNVTLRFKIQDSKDLISHVQHKTNIRPN